jgi:DNA polymerase-3 subunit alpha
MLRRAMGKKKPEEMAKQRQVWMDGCAKNSIDPDVAEELFDAIEKFAGYGFNRSHAAAYALITYQTAWLKLYHPLEFSAALLTIEAGDMEKLAAYVRHVRSSGIKVMGPDVNMSVKGFEVEGDVVRWGLGAVKGMGDALLTPLVASQPYTDLYDLAERSGLPRSALKTLVDAGACDRFSGNRESLRQALTSAVKRGKKSKAADISGQTSMFGVVEIQVSYPPATPAADDLEREWKVLGSFVSGHPARGWTGSRPGDFHDQSEVTGVVVDVFERRAKKSGRQWAKVTIEDEEASMLVILFPDDFENIGGDFGVGDLTTFYGYKKDGKDFVAGGCRVQ